MICSLLGPNFGQIHFDNDKCLNGLLLPNAFKSIEDFCERFQRASKQDQRYLTDAAFRNHIGIKGIIRVDALIEQCCKRCKGVNKNRENFNGLIKIENISKIK